MVIITCEYAGDGRDETTFVGPYGYPVFGVEHLLHKSLHLQGQSVWWRGES